MPISITDKSQCSGCSACFSVCPKQCIQMKGDDEGFLYPSVDHSKCVDCGKCIKACPIISPPATHTNVVGYAAKAKEESVRLSSSSGGIFYLLASKVIEKGGFVFGAALDEDCSVKHICAESKEELKKLQRSKYVQSDIGETFKTAKRFLDEGRFVLFSGTPCQIAGFKNTLGREYENLVLQDLVCHGVPSDLVLNKYKREIEQNEKSIIKDINFREQSLGWYDLSISTVFINGNKRISRHRDDKYMLDFLFNYSLRPSCYDCKFKGIQRSADITLADFWGIDKMMPEMFDDTGVSLVMIQSPNGKALFEEITESIDYQEADLKQAAKYNTAIVESVKLPVERKTFFKKLKKSDYSAAHTAAKKRHLVDAIKRRIIKR